MSLWTWVEEMRTKSEKERRNIALLSSFGITAVIALVWIASSYMSGGPGQSASAINAVETESPFSLLKAQIQNVGATIKVGAEEVMQNLK